MKIAEVVFGWKEIELRNNGVFTGRVPGSRFNHFVVPAFHENAEKVKEMEFKLETLGKVEPYIQALQGLLHIKPSEAGEPRSVFKVMNAPFDARCAAALKVCG